MQGVFDPKHRKKSNVSSRRHRSASKRLFPRENLLSAQFLLDNRKQRVNVRINSVERGDKASAPVVPPQKAEARCFEGDDHLLWQLDKNFIGLNGVA